MSSHYNPDQPRVPAGHEDGGQWTGGGSGSQSILNSPFLDRNRLIKAALGLHDGDGQERNVQLAFLDSPKTSSSRHPSISLPRIALKPGLLFPLKRLPYIGAALSLYSLLSDFNDDEQQAIIAFKSREFRRPNDGAFDLEGVQILRDPQEVKDICGDRFEDVQRITDAAYDVVKSERKQLPPGPFGTEVHKRIEAAIKALGDKKVEAEVTYEKEKPSDPNRKERRGARESIRVDVRNKVDEETVCVDEIKTGGKGLSFERMQEIVRRESARDDENKIKRIVVTEVRPKNAPFPKPKPTPTLQSE